MGASLDILTRNNRSMLHRCLVLGIGARVIIELVVILFITLTSARFNKSYHIN